MLPRIGTGSTVGRISISRSGDSGEAPIFTPRGSPSEKLAQRDVRPRFNFEGTEHPLVLPPTYGLAGVTNETYTAEGPISYHRRDPIEVLAW